MIAKTNAKIVLGVDIGTTNIKCFAYDNKAKILGSARDKIPEVQNVDDGMHEIDPEKLWIIFQKVIRKCLKSAQLTAQDVTCLGISTQRATFVNWNGESCECLHNFITWKDKRAENFCKQLNSSLIMKLFRFGAYILYLLTRKKQFEIGSSVQLSPAMVLPRLYMVLQDNKKVKDEVLKGRALFGTIDTWLVWKLTGGKVHATESSNACVTGFFDPLKLEWANWIMKIFSIPTAILPTVKNTCDYFGETLPNIFGAAIPICALIGDQQASMVGAGCFSKSDINCTIGTGAFVNINTGSTPVTFKGGYPLVGWTIASQPTYVSECGVYDFSKIMDIALDLGLFSHPAETDKVAQSVSDANNVYFFPENSVLQTSNTGNSYMFIGVKSETTQAHLIRSILESLSFQLCSLLDCIYENVDVAAGGILKIGGGVSNSDVILQLVSNVTNRQINRMKNNECSSLGAAFLAGLYCGVWRSFEEINFILDQYDAFSPNECLTVKYQQMYFNWRQKLRTTILL